jgi:hypothetical protein
VETHEILLWNHWAMLALFLAIVTLEWVLRKIGGLA